MRQALSFAATFLTESLSLFLSQIPSLLEGIELQRPPFLVTPFFSASTYFSIYAVNPLPNNHGGQTTHLHQPLGDDSHARLRRQRPQSRLQSEVHRPNKQTAKSCRLDRATGQR